MFRYADDAELQGKEHPEPGSGRTRTDLPMSTIACLLLGAAMAGLYHLLPRTRPGRPYSEALTSAPARAIRAVDEGGTPAAPMGGFRKRT